MGGTRKYLMSLGGMLLVALACSAQEQKIQRSELPPAVEAKVAAESAGATIKGFSREKEKGQTIYEMELVVNGHGKDISMDATGTILEIEEEVAIDALPTAVKDALNAKAKNGKIVKVESLTKRDKLVAYEADVVIDGKRSEIQVGPDGKPLAHEE
jgi:hypothetical protein